MTNTYRDGKKLLESDKIKGICLQAKKVISGVAEYISKESKEICRNHIEVKANNDFVTYVDKTAEEKLVKGLSEICPDAGYITEEKTVAEIDNKLQWIIDPLDGTTNFIYSIPCYAVSVALKYGDDVLLGIVHEVNQNESFYGWKGGGAFLNGSKIKTNSTLAVKDALVATGFSPVDRERLGNSLNTFEFFTRKSVAVRRLGSAAVDLAYVACGRFDLFYEEGLHAWDVAAGSVLVKEAGGKVSDYSGNSNYLFGKEIIASTEGMHRESLTVLKKFY